ncbi:unnamed protein product [Amoebophrya sp. A120]|nr:unnamed protein product [Amoebophrya sp. A120]|eukprot:GSA120T00005840001.1
MMAVPPVLLVRRMTLRPRPASSDVVVVRYGASFGPSSALVCKKKNTGTTAQERKKVCRCTIRNISQLCNTARKFVSKNANPCTHQPTYSFRLLRQTRKVTTGPGPSIARGLLALALAAHPITHPPGQHCLTSEPMRCKNVWVWKSVNLSRRFSMTPMSCNG